MSFGGANLVEGDFEDDGGLNLVDSSGEFLNGGFLEMIGELFDFMVGEPGVGFSDGAQFSRCFVSDGEGVVGEDSGTFAVSLLGGDDHAVESGHDAFEFAPSLAAAAWLVG